MSLSDSIHEIGINSWALGAFEERDDTEPYDTLQKFLDFELTFLDTSPVYAQGKSETIIGETITKLDCEDEFFLSTKCGVTSTSDGQINSMDDNESIMKQVHQSLERLNVKKLNHLGIYRCALGGSLDRQLELLNNLKDKNLTEKIGLILMSAKEQFDPRMELVDMVFIPFSILQPEIDPNWEQSNVDVVSYDPSFGGLISQKYAETDGRVLDHEVRQYHPKFTSDRAEYIQAMKKIIDYFYQKGRDDIDLEILAIEWCRQHVAVDTTIVGVRNTKDLHKAYRALKLELEDESFEYVKKELQTVKEQSGLPDFCLPPPLLPRHSFEHHIIGKE